MFVDSHCHINFKGLTDRLPAVLENMREHDVTHALCVSVDFETLPEVLAIADAHDNVYASVGVHPDHEDMHEPTLAEPSSWPRTRRSSRSAKRASTTTVSKAARSPTWNGSANAFARISAPRPRR